VPRLRGLLGYLGTATLVQAHAKADVECVRYYAEDEPGWFGRFSHPAPGDVMFVDGNAIICFPGGEDAVVRLSSVRADAGRYTVIEWLDGRRWPAFTKRWPTARG
jgi:hypothetical protein